IVRACLAHRLRRGATDIKLGRSALRTAERCIEDCALDAEIPSRIRDRAVPGPQGAADVEEFVAARIALFALEEVAIVALLAVAVTVDEVQPDASPGEHCD